MQGFPILEIAISLALIYLLMAVLVSGFGELWSTVTHKRARMMKNAIHRLLVGDDPKDAKTSLIFQQLKKNTLSLQPTKDDFTHKVMRTISFGKYKNPDFPVWIDPQTFAQSVISYILKFDPEAVESGNQSAVYIPPRGTGVSGVDPQLEDFMDQLDLAEETLSENLGKGKDLPPIFPLLDNLVSVSENIDELEAKLLKWFDEYSGALTSDYKRALRWPLFISAAVLTVLMNVDSMQIIEVLWDDDATRTEVANAAESFDANTYNQDISGITPDSAKTPSNTELLSDINQAGKELESFGLPIGWNTAKDYGIGTQKDDIKFVFETRNSDPFDEFQNQAIAQQLNQLSTEVILSEDSLVSIRISKPEGIESVNHMYDESGMAAPQKDLTKEYILRHYRESMNQSAQKFILAPDLETDTLHIPKNLTLDSLKLEFVSGTVPSPTDPVEASRDPMETKLIYAELEKDLNPVPSLVLSPKGYVFSRFLTRQERTAKELKIEVEIGNPENNQITVTNHREIDPYGYLTFWEVFKRNWALVNFSKLLGWFVTAFAASLGAPFWFDLLRKILSIKK